MVECPECGWNFELKNNEQGEILVCKDCGVELEIFSLEPPVVKLAPQEEEDWGE